MSKQHTVPGAAGKRRRQQTAMLIETRKSDTKMNGAPEYQPEQVWNRVDRVWERPA